MSSQHLLTYLLRLADTALINGHRLSEWCGHAPVLEEDLALANIALDMIGQARMLYAYAGNIEAKGRDEDALAYLRDVASYRNIIMVELPRGNFAFTIVRQLFLSASMQPMWQALCTSKDPRLAGIAGKAVKEVTYHLRHASEWMIRLGDGTPESTRRIQAAMEELWPYTGEMFESDVADLHLIDSGVAVDPARIAKEFNKTIDTVCAQCFLPRPQATWMQTGGRHGRHSEHLGHILAELQYLQRAYPGAKW